MALGALIIKEKLGISDIETVEQIRENPYLQYFIGLKEYKLTRPFTPVAMVKFRKRFNAKRLAGWLILSLSGGINSYQHRLLRLAVG